jgi:hypothetical protein
MNPASTVEYFSICFHRVPLVFLPLDYPHRVLGAERNASCSTWVAFFCPHRHPAGGTPSSRSSIWALFVGRYGTNATRHVGAGPPSYLHARREGGVMEELLCRGGAAAEEGRRSLPGQGGVCRRRGCGRVVGGPAQWVKGASSPTLTESRGRGDGQGGARSRWRSPLSFVDRGRSRWRTPLLVAGTYRRAKACPPHPRRGGSGAPADEWRTSEGRKEVTRW